MSFILEDPKIFIDEELSSPKSPRYILLWNFTIQSDIYSILSGIEENISNDNYIYKFNKKSWTYTGIFISPQFFKFQIIIYKKSSINNSNEYIIEFNRLKGDAFNFKKFYDNCKSYFFQINNLNLKYNFKDLIHSISNCDNEYEYHEKKKEFVILILERLKEEKYFEIIVEYLLLIEEFSKEETLRKILIENNIFNVLMEYINPNKDFYILLYSLFIVLNFDYIDQSFGQNILSINNIDNDNLETLALKNVVNKCKIKFNL